jgi:hypothetical protein
MHVAGFCEHSNEYLCSIKCLEFFDSLNVLTVSQCRCSMKLLGISSVAK